MTVMASSGEIPAWRTELVTSSLTRSRTSSSFSGGQVIFEPLQRPASLRRRTPSRHDLSADFGFHAAVPTLGLCDHRPQVYTNRGRPHPPNELDFIVFLNVFVPEIIVDLLVCSAGLRYRIT